MEIKCTNSLENHFIHCLITAPSGFGKTRLASTLDLKKTLIVSLESGLLSLRKHKINYVEVKSFKQLISMLPEIEASEYENIYFDSLSEIASLFVEEAERKFPDPAQSFPLWKYYNKLMERFIRLTRDMKKNTFYTSLLKTVQNDTGQRFHYPDIPGSIATKLPAYFDYVFTILINKKGRQLLTSSLDGYICKDRSGVLEQYEEMDLKLIIKKGLSNV
jgi:hypothetical protein